MGEPLNPGNLPKHLVILTKHSGCLRTTLADGIKEIVRELNGRFVVKDYQLKDILEKAKTQPEDSVSDLIDIIKGSQEHFDEFIQCLNGMGYTGLVEKLTGTVIAAVGSTEKVNTTCEITNLPDAVAIEGRKGLMFTVTGKTSNNQPLVFKSSWDPKEAEQYFTLHPEDDELRVHVESDPVFTCKSVTLTVTVNDGISDSLPANLEIVEAEVRVILIGKTGVGKSALGNSILDLSPDTGFISRSSAASVTCCNSHQHRVREVAGEKCIFKILDTPGLSDTKISQEEITRELAKCVDDLEPGPHIFSFVLPICRVDGHVMETIEQYKDLFGECLKTYGVVIFTKKDALQKTSFTEYYKDAKPEFKDFLEDYCGNRYSLINNEDPHPDVQGILSLMLKTKRNNNSVHYRHAMFEEAKKLYAEKLKKIEDEKTKVERKLKQQLELKEEQAKEFKQQLELNEENEKKLKQQLELKEEQEKKFKQQLELNEENEKKLKQQLELNEGQEKEFKQKLELKEENEKKLKHQLELKEEEEKEFKKLFEQLKEDNKNKEREMEWENKQLKEQVQKLQDKSPKLLEELNKQTPSDQETDVNSVINPQPQIAEVEKSKQTVDIRGEDFEISNPSGQEIDLKTAAVSQPQIAEVEKLRHTVNIQNIDFVKLCNLLLQDGYLNEKDKEDIVSSETSINTMDTLMDILKQTNNNKAYIIVINHLKSGTSMETASSTQGNFPKHVVILRTHSGCLRTTLADGIKEIARKLNERFVVHDYQLKNILEKAKTQPEDAVSDLIDIMKDSKKNFDAFIQCLNDMGYTGLVEKLTDDPTHETMVQADQSDGIKTDNENKENTDIEVVAKPNITEPVKEQRSLVKNVGRMPKDQYTNIQSNLPFLVDNLIPDNLIDRLFSKGVFDNDDLEKINKEKENGRRAVVYQMLMVLLKCGERAYELFIESLQEEGFIRAVEILENVPQTNTGRVRGKIPQIEYDRLISHYNYLIHTIDPWTLSTRLLTNKVIDQDELEQITNQKLEGRSEVARKLLNILMYCGPGTLDKLVQSLREEGRAEIADQLESGSDDTYDHLVIDEENKGMTIPDDKTTDNNTMDVHSICRTCRDGTLDDVKNLILHNIDFNIRCVWGRTPLFYCVESPYQQLEKVKLLVSTGVRLDVKDNGGLSLLHYACLYSTTIECIKYLLEQGLDKDARDKYNNRTPLFYCVLSKYLPEEKFKLLVSTGAMVDVKDDYGCSLLDWARRSRRTKCESYLRELSLDK